MTVQPLIVERLENEIEFLRRELKRKDQVLAAALERIPAIELPAYTPSELRESPETASDTVGDPL